MAEQFRTLVNADVESWERKYLDFFVLSFCLIGMNTEWKFRRKTTQVVSYESDPPSKVKIK